MEHPRHLRLFRQLLAGIDRGELQMNGKVTRLPVDRYLSQAVFDREWRTLFRAYPLVVAHASELPHTSSCLTHDALGVPLLLTRDEEGAVHAYLNRCSHRGTRLLDAPSGCTHRKLVCPYHQWVYGLGGALERIPLEHGFAGCERAELGLVSLPCAERGGLIWVRPAPGTSMDIDGWLGPMASDLDTLGIATSRVFRRSTAVHQANWKLVMDAFLESYHVQRLHKKSIAGFFTDGHAVMEVDGNHMIASVARNEILEARELPESAWDDRYHTTHSVYLLPNTLLVCSPDYTSIIHMYPRSVRETELVHTMIVPHAPEDQAEHDHWERSFELLDQGVFRGEDFYIAEQAQRGLEAGGPDHVLAGRFELGLTMFADKIEELMQRAERTGTASARPQTSHV